MWGLEHRDSFYTDEQVYIPGLRSDIPELADVPNRNVKLEALNKGAVVTEHTVVGASVLHHCFLLGNTGQQARTSQTPDQFPPAAQQRPALCGKICTQCGNTETFNYLHALVSISAERRDKKKQVTTSMSLDTSSLGDLAYSTLLAVCNT